MPRKVDYAALVPPGETTKVTSLEELLAYRRRIPEWIIYWDEQKVLMKHKIKTLESARQLLSETTIEGLREQAKSYEAPAFSTFRSLNDEHPLRYVYPTDTDSRLRRPDATTFNACGWCLYARNQPGTPESVCLLRPICMLMSAELTAKATNGHGLSFHGLCPLLRLTDADLSDCIAHLEAEQNTLAKERRRYASRSQRFQHILAEN